MRIIWLRAFCITAKLNSFTVAAKEMNTSQSSVSKYIGALEKEMGLKLFDRSAWNVRLTDDGKAVLPYAERIVENCSALYNLADL